MKPDGATAFRDAYLVGIKKIIEIYGIINKLGFSEVWNFVHIVLTDGEDTSSKSTIKDVTALQALLGATLGAKVKTWLLGVDIDEKAQSTKDMLNLSRLGGESIKFANVGTNEINEIFQKIVVSLGKI